MLCQTSLVFYGTPCSRKTSIDFVVTFDIIMAEVNFPETKTDFSLGSRPTPSVFRWDVLPFHIRSQPSPS